MRKVFCLFFTLAMILFMVPIQPAVATGAVRVVYLDGTNGKDTNTGTDADHAVASLKKAIELLAENGGTIMVIGDTNVDSSDDEYPAYAGRNIVLPDHNGTIHIKGVKKPDGSYTKLIQTDTSTFTTLGFKGDLIISDIVLKTTQNLMICMRGHNLTMGYNIEVERHPTISTTGVWIYGYSQSAADAGTKPSDYVYNQTINIYSGTYDLITGTGASGAMRLNGEGNNPLNKVNGDLVFNFYGGTLEGPNTKILSCENNGEVEGNDKGFIFDFSKLNLSGQSHKITGHSVLNLYNYTEAEVNTFISRIASDSVYTEVNSLTGTIPVFTPPYQTPAVFKGAQTSLVVDNKYNIRFVATVDTLNYERIGFEITAGYTENGTAITTEFTKSCAYVYQKITGNTAAGLQEYTAEELGGNYLMALSIINIPADLGTISFFVKPYVVENGVKIFGHAYTVVCINGVIDIAVYTDWTVSGTYDCGDNNLASYVTNTTKQAYDAYCTLLATNGYTLHSDNTIGNNYYATYTSNNRMVHVYYLHNLKEIRIISAPVSSAFCI